MQLWKKDSNKTNYYNKLRAICNKLFFPERYMQDIASTSRTAHGKFKCYHSRFIAQAKLQRL